MSLADVSAERAVLAGPFKFGRDAFVDVDDLVNDPVFSLDFNKFTWSCIKDFYEQNEDRNIDLPSLVSTARKLGYGEYYEQEDAKRHLRALLNYPIELPTVRAEAAKLLKISIINQLSELNIGVSEKLNGLTGDESLNQIISLVENPFFEYTAKLNGDSHDTKQIGEGIDDWLENVLSQETDNLGIPTPFPTFNKQIGGGFRRRGVGIVAARAKSGKTVLCDNVAIHVAGTLGIPVFNLDTEMTDEEHWARILSHLTGIPMDRIERGRVDQEEAKLLKKKAKWLKSIPYFYRSVIDETFEEQVAAMRRWIVKTVGVNESGIRNNCLIIYDYLQLTDPGEFSGNNFKEYQLLGFQIVSLCRMAKKYDVPILSTLQLNREGIDKETTAAASGSDRIVWKCSNFSIIKRKTEEEIVADGEQEGNLKLLCVVARHGAGTDHGDYINIKFDGATAKMVEGRTRRELDRGKKPSTQKGFEVEENGPDDNFEFRKPLPRQRNPA